MRVFATWSLAVTLLLSLMGCAGQSLPAIPGVNDGTPALSVPTSVSLPPVPGLAVNEQEMIKAALAQMGITSVQYVKPQDGGHAVWVSVPKFENCPVRVIVFMDRTYKADQLQRPDGSRQPLADMPPNPGPIDFAGYAAQNPLKFWGCAGADQAPPALPTD